MEFNIFFFFQQYNAVYDVAVSADEAGMIEYWSGIKHDVQFPKNVNFEFKTDTDLFEFIMVSGGIADHRVSLTVAP